MADIIERLHIELWREPHEPIWRDAIAKIEALRADMADYMRIANTEATRAERLAEALRELLDETTDRIDCSRSSAGTIVDVVERVRELLRDQKDEVTP